MSTKELQQELAALVKAAEDALRAAEVFADKHNLQFYFEPSYGMGGCYVGGDGGNYEEHGWNPSSQSC